MSFSLFKNLSCLGVLCAAGLSTPSLAAQSNDLFLNATSTQFHRTIIIFTKQAVEHTKIAFGGRINSRPNSPRRATGGTVSSRRHQATGGTVQGRRQKSTGGTVDIIYGPNDLGVLVQPLSKTIPQRSRRVKTRSSK